MLDLGRPWAFSLVLPLATGSSQSIDYFRVSPSTLTHSGYARSVLSMRSSNPSILGMSLSRFAARARQAGERAVAANLLAGVPVTGLRNGRLETITHDDLLGVKLMAKTSNGRVAGVD